VGTVLSSPWVGTGGRWRPRTWSSWLLALGLLALAGCTPPKPRVVLYCAQDREFADGLLRDFTTESGLPVAPKFDTEANKSVSLFVELVHEKDRPRCDVHWNNEILSTLRLQRQGLLEPYDSPAAAPYPLSAKVPDHTWHAFTARARAHRQHQADPRRRPEAAQPPRTRRAPLEGEGGHGQAAVRHHRHADGLAVKGK
jgi:hypothetical protein